MAMYLLNNLYPFFNSRASYKVSLLQRMVYRKISISWLSHFIDWRQTFFCLYHRYWFSPLMIDFVWLRRVNMWILVNKKNHQSRPTCIKCDHQSMPPNLSDWPDNLRSKHSCSCIIHHFSHCFTIGERYQVVSRVTSSTERMVGLSWVCVIELQSE